MHTLIIQSQRTPLPAKWLEPCLASVKQWAELKQYHYRFLDDALFVPVPQLLMEKTAQQKVIASDLARLMQLQQGLAEGYQRVVWLDADFLIFAPEQFQLMDQPFALGREVWIQPDAKHLNRPRAYRKVHNAFLQFDQGNHFLDFYYDSAQRLLTQTQGPMPPQFIGPKLLTALHNVVQCPVHESAAMFSPMVIEDLLAGGGRALKLFKQKSSQPAYGANLCSSMTHKGELTAQQMEAVIKVLLEQQMGV